MLGLRVLDKRHQPAASGVQGQGWMGGGAGTDSSTAVSARAQECQEEASARAVLQQKSNQ